MEINPLLNNPIEGVSSLDKKASAGTGFSQLLTNAIEGTVDAQRAAEKMTARAAIGEDVPMHKVIEAVNRAETTLKTMLNVRDKAVTAYQEILRMPI